MAPLPQYVTFTWLQMETPRATYFCVIGVAFLLGAYQLVFVWKIPLNCARACTAHQCV